MVYRIFTMKNTTTPRPMTFHFTKIFTEETPAFQPGDKFADTITFPSLSSFTAWVRGVNKNNAKGSVPYRVEV